MAHWCNLFLARKFPAWDSSWTATGQKELGNLWSNKGNRLLFDREWAWTVSLESSRSWSLTAYFGSVGRSTSKWNKSISTSLDVCCHCFLDSTSKNVVACVILSFHKLLFKRILRLNLAACLAAGIPFFQNVFDKLKLLKLCRETLVIAGVVVVLKIQELPGCTPPDSEFSPPFRSTPSIAFYKTNQTKAYSFYKKTYQRYHTTFPLTLLLKIFYTLFLISFNLQKTNSSFFHFGAFHHVTPHLFVRLANTFLRVQHGQPCCCLGCEIFKRRVTMVQILCAYNHFWYVKIVFPLLSF